MTTLIKTVDDVSVLDLVKKQLQSREHRFADWQEVLDAIAHNKAFEGAYAGTYSLTTKDRELTLVDTKHKWCGKPVSASTISRLALETPLIALGRKRFFWTMKALPLLEEVPPYYAIPGHHDYLIYADITACYYSLYRILPLYLYYWGLKPIYGCDIFDQFLPVDIADYKLVRNSVVGTMRSFSSTRVRGGKLVKTANKNKFLMPCHWGAIVEQLHYFAQLAIQNNAVYYNTDGGIFTSEKDALKWCDAIKSLGFQVSIKAQGAGQVQGLGAYRVGDLGTIRLGRKPRSYNNLKQPNGHIIKMFDKLVTKT